MAHPMRSARAKTGYFLGAWALMFVCSLSALDSVGFVPYYIDDDASPAVFVADLPELGSEPERNESVTPTALGASALPQRIVIDEIAVDLPVLNPQTRDLAELDEHLKDGAVRHMDSARLGAKGNVLIFAHTSHLPVVHNAMYKAFNRVPELSAGDSITLVGEDGTNYLYSVLSVERVNAEDAVIDLAPEGNYLTLVTCDTLTSKSARFVLKAELVGSF